MDPGALNRVGEWVIVRGEWRRRGALAGGTIATYDPPGNNRFAYDEIDELVSVRGRATWRGGTVEMVEHRDDGTVWILTRDPSLVERESATLQGHRNDDWHAIVPAGELSDITIRVARWRRRDQADLVEDEYSIS